MLFNVLFVVILLYALIIPYFALKLGMKIAEKDENKAETPIFNIPKTTKKPETTRKERQEIQKWQNVMNYNGTSAGQVKISEVK